MKKLAALLMVFVLAFLSCACKKDKKENTVTGADIEYYAKIGQIPESDIKLSADPDSVLSKLKKSQNSSALESHDHEEGAEEIEIPVIESGDYSEILGNNFQYYYKTEDKSGGITAITATAAAFGYDPDTVLIEIETDLKSRNIKYEVTSGKLSDFYFFSFSDDNCKFLTCESEKNSVVFAFIESKLSAAAVYAK